MKASGWSRSRRPCSSWARVWPASVSWPTGRGSVATANPQNRPHDNLIHERRPLGRRSLVFAEADGAGGVRRGPGLSCPPRLRAMADDDSNLPDAAQLTRAFRAAGVLHDDQITRVTVESTRQTLVSTIRHLRLDLGSSSPALRLFLKTGRADSGIAIPDSREASFYTLVAPLSPPDLLPRCFESVSGGAASWRILLEDLTDSHEVVSEWPIPPTMEQCERIIGAHARFHAAWWDDQRLGHGVGTFTDET